MKNEPKGYKVLVPVEPRCGAKVPEAWRHAGSCDLPKGHIPAHEHAYTTRWSSPQ